MDNKYWLDWTGREGTKQLLVAVTPIKLGSWLILKIKQQQKPNPSTRQQLISLFVCPSVCLAISFWCYCCCWRIKELNVWPTDVRLLTILIPPLFMDAAAFYIPYERTDGQTDRQMDG